LARGFRLNYRFACSTIRSIAAEMRGLPLDEYCVGTVIAPSCHEAVLKLGQIIDAAIRKALQRDSYSEVDIAENWEAVSNALRPLFRGTSIEEEAADRRLR
jgi:hypothetical protein